MPQPNLANSPRIDTLVSNGVLELSLKDAITLSLENNLDIAIARYNIPIAAADILRTQAGGLFRGVNTGVVQNTPGGGVGGFGSGVERCGRGRNIGRRGRRRFGRFRAGVSRRWAPEPMSRRTILTITGTFNNEHYTQPLSNTSIYGVPTLQQNTTNGNIELFTGISDGNNVFSGVSITVAARRTARTAF